MVGRYVGDVVMCHMSFLLSPSTNDSSLKSSKKNVIEELSNNISKHLSSRTIFQVNLLSRNVL